MQTTMDNFDRLLQAAIKGETQELNQFSADVLDQTTEKGNTCLHIAALCGHQNFCSEVLAQESRLHRPGPSSLLSTTNDDGETPLLVAVKSGRVSLALHLLDQHYSMHNLLVDHLLKQDTSKCNVLHHAIRNGYKDLALKLIQQQPALSESCNAREESPMFIAVLKGFRSIYMELLRNERSEYGGARGYNALHAAVKYGNQDFVEQLVDQHPEKAKELARQADTQHDTPVQLAAHFNRDTILTLMLRGDRSLGYRVHAEHSTPLLYIAANRGHVAFARALLEHCPDAPYKNDRSRTCLHEAVEQDRTEFVKFILDDNSKLRKLVNMVDDVGDTALHLAVQKSNPRMVRALLRHPDIDLTVINNRVNTAIWNMYNDGDEVKTINWNKIYLLIRNADRRAKNDIYNFREEIRNKVNYATRKDAKSLIQTYTTNTSLVAILLATITFAAAFTLPGGYSSDAGSEGLPVMARKVAFQAFLILDTSAMCASLAVAFVCVIVRWMDFEFLLHYRSVTTKLMWFAYMATTLAFATGLYTVLEDRLPWLAIAICVLSVLLPILTMLVGGWPILKLRIQYGKSDFLDMV